MSEMMVEWAPFTLAEGVTEAELMEASQALQEDFLGLQDGFIDRRLLRGSEREWCDLVFWRDAQAVERAMSQVSASPVCYRYFNLMVAVDHAEPDAGVQLFSVKRSYAARAVGAAIQRVGGNLT